MTEKQEKKLNNSEGKEPEEDSDELRRRNLLKVGLGLGVVLAIGGIGAIARTLISPGAQAVVAETSTQTTASSVLQSTSATENGTSSQSVSKTITESSETSSSASATVPPPATPGFPVILVANLSDLTVGTPINFNYPLQETPNILVKLGLKALNGVGPDGDIVAYSQVCQHLGCIYAFIAPGSSPACNGSYKATGPVGYCCCHGSVYDLVNGAKVIGGPAPRPQPSVILNFDSSSGNIYATGMTPPTIFGYDTGSNDVSNDLQGGTLV